MSLLLMLDGGSESSEHVFVPPSDAFEFSFNLDGEPINQYVRASNETEITYNANSRTVARCEAIDPLKNTALAWRPTVEQELAIGKADGTLMFVGTIATVRESPIAPPNTGTLSAVDATGYEAVADMRFVRKSYGTSPLPITIIYGPGNLQTVEPHGLTVGATVDVIVEGVVGAVPAVNGAYQATVTGPYGLSLPGVNLTASGGAGTVRVVTRAKAILSDLVAKLSGNGITLDPTMDDGPFVEKFTVDGTVGEAIRKLSEITGLVIRFTPTKVVEAFIAGDRIAPFTLDGNNILGGVNWSRTAIGKANKIRVRYGAQSNITKQEVFRGDGSRRTFELRYKVNTTPPVPNWDTSDHNWNGTGMTEAEWRARYPGPSVILPETFVDGQYRHTANGFDPLFEWYFVKGDGENPDAIAQNPAYPVLSAGNTLTVNSPVTFPQEVVWPLVDPTNPKEAEFDEPEVFDYEAALERAQAHYRRLNAPPPREATIQTKVGPPQFPGTVFHVTLPERTLTQDMLIVRSRFIESDQGVVTYEYSLIEGGEARQNWIDYFRSKSGGSGRSSGTVSGGVLPPGAGGGSGGVGGTGTPDTIPRWTGATTLGDSPIVVNGGGLVEIGVGILVNGDAAFSGNIVAAGSVSTPTLTSTANIAVSPAGNIDLDPGGDLMQPAQNYRVNLGSITNKFLTLHALELWVENLVASNVMATIGGHIVVAPTNELTEDVTASQTFIKLKYNDVAVGDKLMLQGFGTFEGLKVTAGPTGTGPYTYTVTRGWDLTPPNTWTAGSAVVNTGQTGNGFMDIISVRGVRSNLGQTEYGPAIIGNVRTGDAFDQIEKRFVFGNLRGTFGYSGSTNVYGVAMGKEGAAYVTVDPTFGVRIGNGTGLFAQITPSGTAQFTGQITVLAGSNVEPGATAGATWGVNLGGIPSVLGPPSGSGLFLGSSFMGYYTGGVWKSYFDNAGNMHLGNWGSGGYGMWWNQSAGQFFVRGTAQIDSGNIGGWYINAGQLGPSGGGSGLYLNPSIIGFFNATTNAWLSYMTSGGLFALLRPDGSVGLAWDGNTLTISGGSGAYVPTGGAAADVNANTTTISGGKITTGSITADKINVTSLSAISANIGNVTAGSITGVTITGGLATLDGSGITLQAGTGSGNKVKWDNGGYVTSSGSTIVFGNGTGWNFSFNTNELICGGGKLGNSGSKWDSLYVDHIFCNMPTDAAGSYEPVMLNTADMQLHRGTGAYTGDASGGDTLHIFNGIIRGIN